MLEVLRARECTEFGFSLCTYVCIDQQISINKIAAVARRYLQALLDDRESDDFGTIRPPCETFVSLRT